MMNLKRLTLITLIGIFALSCNDQKESKEDKQAPVSNVKESSIHGSWTLNFIANNPKTLDELFPEGMPSLAVDADESRISGKSGCNNFTGSYSSEGDKFEVVEPLAVTRKMCPEMTGEDLFLGSLPEIDSYALTDSGNTLSLLMGSDLVMRFERDQ